MTKRIIEIEVDDEKVSNFQTFVKRLEGFLDSVLVGFKIDVKKTEKK